MPFCWVAMAKKQPAHLHKKYISSWCVAQIPLLPLILQVFAPLPNFHISVSMRMGATPHLNLEKALQYLYGIFFKCASTS